MLSLTPAFHTWIAQTHVNKIEYNDIPNIQLDLLITQ